MFQSPPKPKRNYVIGGRYGKVKGFDFYLQDREKLKPFQRRILLNESEDLISRLINEEFEKLKDYSKIDTTLTFLDSELTDLELLEIWNDMYVRYGFRMSPFRDKWEREMIGTLEGIGDEDGESKPFKPIKIDSFKDRLEKVRLSNMG